MRACATRATYPMIAGVRPFAIQSAAMAVAFTANSCSRMPVLKSDWEADVRPDIDRKPRSSRVRASKTKAATMIPGQMRSLAILAALALAGCTVATLNLGATDYKGKPLSDVTAKLGQPNEVRTIAGQKAYIWNVGNTLYACQIRVVMAGDVVDTYEGSGDVNICAQYGALSGGLKGYRE